MQSAGADVFNALVDLKGQLGQASNAFVEKVNFKFSTPRSALYWSTKLKSGSVKMRSNSLGPSASSSTRIGRRPCNSGIKSEGLDRWNAPEAINKMWSVLIGPYLVLTVLPSINGSKSR